MLGLCTGNEYVPQGMICSRHFYGDSTHTSRWLPFPSEVSFFLPEQKMPIWDPRSTAGNKGSRLCALVISLMVCYRARPAHGCDYHESTDWGNITPMGAGNLLV